MSWPEAGPDPIKSSSVNLCWILLLQKNYKGILGQNFGVAESSVDLRCNFFYRIGSRPPAAFCLCFCFSVRESKLFSRQLESMTESCWWRSLVFLNWTGDNSTRLAPIRSLENLENENVGPNDYKDALTFKHAHSSNYPFTPTHSTYPSDTHLHVQFLNRA